MDELPQGKAKKIVLNNKRELTGAPFIVVTVVAVAGVLFQLYNAGFGTLAEIQVRSMHWAYISLIAFLIYPPFSRSARNKVWVVDWVLAAATFASGLYVYIFWLEIAGRLGFTIPREVVFGVITVILVLELMRRVVGWPLVITVGIFIAYAFLGPYMPMIIIHRGITLEGLIRTLYISTDGIFGMPMGISASFVILFIIFGAFLQESGGGKLFTDVAFGMVGRSTGGPAKASVVSSGLVGMISGAAVANVVTTGVFTIPLMKKTGYTKTSAAAIEAATSTAGQIMPPVMGAAAFMMAEFTGIPYATIALSVVFVAVLNFVFLFVYVHLLAKKNGLKGMSADMLPSVFQSLKERGHLLIPLFVLIGLLIVGRSPGSSVFWAIILIMGISTLRKNTRMSPKQFVRAMRNGAINALPVAVACAGAGIITGIIGITGVGLRFTSILVSLSGGYLTLLLVLAMIAAIIIGMGLPTSAAYAILAILTAPAIVHLGVPPLSAHFFILFFGCLSTITPPVGLSSFAAAGIAEANPMKTCIESFRIGFAGYILPFAAVFRPSILLIGTPFEIVFNMSFTVVLVISLVFAISGVVYRKLEIYERILFLAPTIILFLQLPIMFDFVAVGIVIIAFLLSRRGRPVEAVAR
ncbi:MAG: TRAP transporter permease [Treponema sp.]|nr:TRAP transporter permease [Treponema sp.]